MSASAAVYFFFRVTVTINFKEWSKIKKHKFGRNCIFGRAYTYRQYLFSNKPNELNCARPGFQEAKDESSPQNNLKK